MREVRGNGGGREMNKEVEIIMANLKEYPFLDKYFGNIIEQRLQIACYTHGMLTSHLLELTEFSQSDLDRLEIVLQFAGSCCHDFELITKEDSLSQYQDADAKIVDMLAEVKAFEFLCRYGFRDIIKIKHLPNAKTVDFTAKLNNQIYALEVTRLGLSSSDKKQPVYSFIHSTLKYDAKCEDADGLEISMIGEKLNKERIEEEIYDAIGHEYPQLKEFCQTEDDNWRGIIFISSGRDYFAARKYENKAYEQTPKEDFSSALEQLWQHLKGEQRDKYLHHLVITRGKDLRKAIVSPDFNRE